MSETYKQMDIFDFIEKPPEYEVCAILPEPQTMLQQLFGRVDNPVYRCANCLCNYCANNVEELYCKVKPEEVQEPCFNCDGCREYSGECKCEVRCLEECSKFFMSDYGAKHNRRKLKLVKG